MVSTPDSMIDEAQMGIVRLRFGSPEAASKWSGRVRERLRARRKAGTLAVEISVSLPKGRAELVLGPRGQIGRAGAHDLEQPLEIIREYEAAESKGVRGAGASAEPSAVSGPDQAAGQGGSAAALMAFGEELRRRYPDLAKLSYDDIQAEIRASRQEMIDRYG